MTHIYLTDLNTTDHTATFAIGGARWEYWLHPAHLHTVDYLRKVSLGKALAFAKKHAQRAKRLP